MQYILAEQEKFYVAGIAIKTINKDDQSSKDIGGLWERFMSENIMEKIPGKLSDDIYCVYTDYESDHNDWYRAVIGCRIDEPQINTGLFMALVPDGNYRRYKPQGQFPDCVAGTWRHIWDNCSGRKYIADYDLYKAGANSFEETETEIYVGVV